MACCRGDNKVPSAVPKQPYVTSIVTGVLVAFFAGDPADTATRLLVSIGTLLAFVIVSVGILVLRIREPNTAAVFKTPASGSSLPPEPFPRPI